MPVTTTIPPIQTGTITVSGTLSVFVPCTDYAVSTNGRCGGAYGTKCPSGLCCSKYGYCQDDGGQDGAPWCDAGCQRGFGKCWANVTDPDNYNCPTATATYQLTTISSATPVYMACPSLPVSKDGRCGVDFGGTRCIEGYCCSVAGYCQDDGGNSGEPWCGGGCQIGMGKCFVGTAPLSSTFTCPGSTPSATISSSGSSTLTVRPTSDVANPSTTVYMTTTTQVPTSTSAFTLTTVSAKLPIYQPCTNLNVTSNVTNTCGINYGTRCPSGKCCSAAGLCQVTGNNGKFHLAPFLLHVAPKVLPNCLSFALKNTRNRLLRNRMPSRVWKVLGSRQHRCPFQMPQLQDPLQLHGSQYQSSGISKRTLWKIQRLSLPQRYLLQFPRVVPR